MLKRKKEQEQEQTMEDEDGNWTKKSKKQHIKQPVLIKQQEQHIGMRSTTYV